MFSKRNKSINIRVYPWVCLARHERGECICSVFCIQAAVEYRLNAPRFELMWGRCRFEFLKRLQGYAGFCPEWTSVLRCATWTRMILLVRASPRGWADVGWFGVVLIQHVPRNLGRFFDLKFEILKRLKGWTECAKCLKRFLKKEIWVFKKASMVHRMRQGLEAIFEMSDLSF